MTTLVMGGLPVSAADPPPAIEEIAIRPDPATSPPGVILPHVRPTADSDRGTVLLTGRATPPGVVLTLTTTDDIGTAPLLLDIPTETRDDPNFGVVPGSFRTYLHLTDLGRHRADVSAPAPDDLGRSILELRFTVTNDDGVVTDEATFTIEKRAGTPDDTTAPAITETRRVPVEWCHVVGDSVGNCFAVPPSPFKTGHAEFAGRVVDDTSESLGVASEIADVVVRVFDGDGTLVKERRSFIRVGTRAYYSVVFSINEFAPNAPLGPPYRYTVTAIDAWGHEATPVTGVFNVYAI